jgi:hypothetical protein
MIVSSSWDGYHVVQCLCFSSLKKTSGSAHVQLERACTLLTVRELRLSSGPNIPKNSKKFEIVLKFPPKK